MIANLYPFSKLCASWYILLLDYLQIAVDDVSGQIHAPVTLSTEKEPPVPTELEDEWNSEPIHTVTRTRYISPVGCMITPLPQCGVIHGSPACLERYHRHQPSVCTCSVWTFLIISGTLATKLENILDSVVWSGKIGNTLYWAGPFTSHCDCYISRASWVRQLVLNR